MNFGRWSVRLCLHFIVNFFLSSQAVVRAPEGMSISLLSQQETATTDSPERLVLPKTVDVIEMQSNAENNSTFAIVNMGATAVYHSGAPGLKYQKSRLTKLKRKERHEAFQREGHFYNY